MKFNLEKLTILLLVSFIFPENINIDVGARPIGMAGAYTALADGVSGSYYNPAGLISLNGTEVEFMMSSGMSYDRINLFTGVGIITGQNYWCLSIISARATGFKGYTGGDEYTGDFKISDNNIAITRAMKFISVPISLGVSIKLIHSQIADDAKINFGYDIGARYINNKIRIGIVIKDVYTKYDDRIIHPSLNMGISKEVFNNMLCAVDIKADTNSKIHYSVGGEYEYASANILSENLNLIQRIGFNESGIHFGFGISNEFGKIEYAYLPGRNEEFKPSHRISFIITY